ncbi:MAG: hypothetical protein WDN00_19375 [Limisphaerales bacterium]
MIKSHIQLSDGRLLTITGANAKDVADCLTEKLSLNAGSLMANERAMETPAMNFEVKQRHAPDTMNRNVPVPAIYTNGGQEDAMELPVLNFDPPRSNQRQPASAPAAPVTGVESAMAVPVMTF